MNRGMMEAASGRRVGLTALVVRMAQDPPADLAPGSDSMPRLNERAIFVVVLVVNVVFGPVILLGVGRVLKLGEVREWRVLF